MLLTSETFSLSPARLLVIAPLAVLLIGTAGLESSASLQTEASGKDGAPMVLVPAGPFPMGVPTGDRDGGRDEYPRHEVSLDAYYLDRFEVTNGRYLEFVRATGHRTPQNVKDPSRNLWQGGLMPESVSDRPVINVDWYDADQVGKIKYVEAFEICEYGRQPDKAELKRLFPFFGKPQ